MASLFREITKIKIAFGIFNLAFTNPCNSILLDIFKINEFNFGTFSTIKYNKDQTMKETKINKKSTMDDNRNKSDNHQKKYLPPYFCRSPIYSSSPCFQKLFNFSTFRRCLIFIFNICLHFIVSFNHLLLSRLFPHFSVTQGISDSVNPRNSQHTSVGPHLERFKPITLSVSVHESAPYIGILKT